MLNERDSTDHETAHKRRIRYKGTYPRTYKEKYKELQPEKYVATVERVIEKGSTPAGMHIPIMVPEILRFLQIKPGQQGLDATLGYGGHTVEMMRMLQGRGHMYAMDVDPIESAKTQERLAKQGFGADILTVCRMNFSNLDKLVSEAGLFDFVLADLGVSSMQIDNPDRGFSYKNDGPLDLRMNPEQGLSASERLQSMGWEELAGMLAANADEPFADRIAKTIIKDIHHGQSIDTTAKLHHEIEKALQILPVGDRREAVKKSSARTFQALRIDVNHEYEALYDFLVKLPTSVISGGRIAILTFHSGEDRLVKKAFKEFYRRGIYQAISQEIIRPSAEECIRNPRAHSTKMRWVVRA